MYQAPLAQVKSEEHSVYDDTKAHLHPTYSSDNLDTIEFSVCCQHGRADQLPIFYEKHPNTPKHEYLLELIQRIPEENQMEVTFLSEPTVQWYLLILFI